MAGQLLRPVRDGLAGAGCQAEQMPVLWVVIFPHNQRSKSKGP